jgi:hypothetical protein
MVGIDLRAARVATPEVPAELFGTAGQDVSDGAPMRRHHRRPMRCQIVVRKTAEDIRYLDHGRPLGSEAGHQLVENVLERCPRRLGQVHVNRCRGDIDVPEQDLDDPRIHAAFQKPRRIAVAKGMGRDMSCNVGRGSGLPDCIPQYLAVDRCATAAIGAKPAAIAVGQPKATQFVEDRLWKWDPALLVALADDTNKQIDLIDRRDLKRRSLADTQTARVHEEEPSLVDRILDTPKERSNFSIRKHVGQTLVLGRPDSFFENRDHSRSSVRQNRNWMPP